MIVKSLRRKDRSFAQLVHYISRKAEPGAVLTHNLRADPDDLEAVIDDFMTNSRHLKKRKNGNIMFHEIISLPPTAHLLGDATKVLLHLGERFVQLRAPGQIVYGRVHLDTDFPHLHLIMSANALHSARPVRMPLRGRGSYNEARRQLEAFKILHYPSLHQQFYAQNRTHAPLVRMTEKEQRVQHHQGIRAWRHWLQERTTALFGQTPTIEHLQNGLGTLGVELEMQGTTVTLYHRSSDRRMKLDQLGLLEQWDTLQLRERRTQKRQKELKLMEALRRARGPDCSPPLIRTRQLHRSPPSLGD